LKIFVLFNKSDRANWWEEKNKLDDELLEKIKSAIVNLEVDKIEALIINALNNKIQAFKIINTMTDAMRIVGELFERKEYFLADLIMAGEAFNIGLNVMKPYLHSEQIKSLATIVIGTVKDDIHDIGKNIVSTMLTSAGFKVHDLGADVPPEKFVEKIKETNADILAMSSLLTSTMENMKVTIMEAKKAGIREKVKVIVGGAPLTEQFARQIGADAYGADAVEAIKLCKKFVEK
jgi:methylmalonyl-CoA mutase cobalamin-binding domain/chain